MIDTKLEMLPGDKGMKQGKRRVGRGESSGWGRCAGRGEKGQQARSGGPKRMGFEGGQTPISRRVPKRGFSHANFDVVSAIVNLNQLNRFSDGDVVDINALAQMNIISPNSRTVKILGNGELQKKLTVCANGFSKSAREAIEKAGGSCEETIMKKPSEAGPAEVAAATDENEEKGE
ncbi:MAG: 50S ribosomal protein L15 [Candidatus Sumerlaeia bacterium]